MKKAILFAALAVTLALTGCGTKIIEYIYTDELIFRNRTEVPVRLEAYDDDGAMKALWTVDPETTLKQTHTSDDGGGWGEWTIRRFNKLRVVFGGDRELWSDDATPDTPYNMYNSDNCEIIQYSHTLRQYIYELDGAMMNTAALIVPAAE